MQIGIIGGGASGMMAAIWAAKCGGKVTIIEHAARIGKKILSTGNGKCNFTNQSLSKDDYNGNHPSFAEPVIAKFNQYASVDFFETCGMLTTSKRDGYFYPYTGQASAVLNILRYQLERYGVIIEENEYIVQTRKNKNGSFYVKTKTKKYYFDRLILACGGNAAPATGSDGSGYELAKAFGHKLVKPLPVLTHLKSKEPTLKELAGVRTNARLKLMVDGETAQEETGELQLNKDNISGIPVFQLSHVANRAIDARKKVTVIADFIPEMCKKQLEEKLDILTQMYAHLSVSEALCGLIHKKICVAVLRKAGVRLDKKMADISKEEQSKISMQIKTYCFEITGYPGFEAAQATMGGVDTTEIDENMMSRKADGLYFAGELVDIDGKCGGYNLQWAWSSGYVAGCHSASGDVKCYELTNVK